MGKNVDQATYYVDFERIRKHGGNVYYWSLADFSKPSPWNDLSVIEYAEGDCKLYRRKILDWTFHRKPMGRGDGKKGEVIDQWDSAPPNSILKIILKSVCAYAKENPASAADFQKGYTASRTGDYATALREWTPLAQQGNALAQTNLGTMYGMGLGVSQNKKTALKWYRLAAKQGYARAQVKLGVMYQDGLGVPQNNQTAVKWYRLAAEQGNAGAQFNLGSMYDSGQGVPQNKMTAVKWYRLAAKQGNAAAQSNLDKLERRIAAQKPAPTVTSPVIARKSPLPTLTCSNIISYEENGSKKEMRGSATVRLQINKAAKTVTYKHPRHEPRNFKIVLDNKFVISAIAVMDAGGNRKKLSGFDSLHINKENLKFIPDGDGHYFKDRTWRFFNGTAQEWQCRRPL